MTSIPNESGAGSAAAAAAAPLLRGHHEKADQVWLIAGGLGLTAMLLWVFWDFVVRQLRFAIHQQADWGHTLVIPFIAAYFVHLNREKLRAIGFRPAWTGLLPVVVGVAWYVFCWLGPQAIRHHNLQGAGIAVTLFGLVLLIFGFRAMVILWFPLAYLCVFGQTISDRFIDIVTFKMQTMTAIGSHVVLNMIGIDTDRSGNVLTVWDNGVARHLNIAEACSGMRMLMAFFALGVAMAYTGLSHVWQRVILVIMAVPVAIAVNILRVVTLSLLARIDTDFTAGDFHTFIGLVWLVPAFLIYLGLMWILRNVIVDAPARPATEGVS